MLLQFRTLPPALLVLLVILAGNGCSSPPGTERRSDPRPNVVFIIVDALRADHLGCYGYPKGTTPRIDALAGHSLFYANAYSNATWTVPSSASLFTSTLPVVHRINRPPHNLFAFSVLSDAYVLASEAFQDAGYATGMIATIDWVSPTSNYHQGVDDYQRAKGDADLLRRARRYVSDHAQDRFHLYLHFIDLHDYYDPARIFSGRHDHLIEPTSALLALRGKTKAESYNALSKDLSKEGVLTPGDVDVLKASYDDELATTDRLIGELVDHLAAERLLENTLIVITGDHGEQFLEHQTLMHASDGFFNEVLRIPFIVAGPGRFEGRTTITTPVSSIDFYPTVMSLAGVSRPEHFQGESILEPVEDRAVFATDGLTWKVLTERWTYIRSESRKREELYDLTADPGEKTNLLAGSGAAEHAAIVEDLAGRLEAMHDASRGHQYLVLVENPGEAVMTEEERAALEALGYL